MENTNSSLAEGVGSRSVSTRFAITHVCLSTQEPEEDSEVSSAFVKLVLSETGEDIGHLKRDMSFVARNDFTNDHRSCTSESHDFPPLGYRMRSRDKVPGQSPSLMGDIKCRTPITFAIRCKIFVPRCCMPQPITNRQT